MGYVTFFIRYWKPISIGVLAILLLVLGSLMMLIHGVISMLTAPFDFFLGSDSAKQFELVQAYKSAGNEYNVYWPDLAAYDTIHTKGKLEQLTKQQLEATIKIFSYEVESCTGTESERKCVQEKRFYTLEEVLEREGTEQKDIEYARYISENMLTMNDTQPRGTVHIDPKVIASEAFLWPVPDIGNLTSGFEQRVNPVTGEEEFHNGIDIANGQSGLPVVASADGTVIHWCNDPNSTAGRWIRIQHEGNYQTRYLHMGKLAVPERTDGTSTQVKKGQVIGYIGSTGQSTGAHLHFEMRKNGELFDPLILVGKTRPK